MFLHTIFGVMNLGLLWCWEGRNYGRILNHLILHQCFNFFPGLGHRFLSAIDVNVVADVYVDVFEEANFVLSWQCELGFHFRFNPFDGFPPWPAEAFDVDGLPSNLRDPTGSMFFGLFNISVMTSNGPLHLVSFREIYGHPDAHINDRLDEFLTRGSYEDLSQKHQIIGVDI
jgi:hypothetical protein